MKNALKGAKRDSIEREKRKKNNRPEEGPYLISNQGRDNITGIVWCLILGRHEMYICVDHDRGRRRLAWMESMSGMQLVMCGAESFAGGAGAADAGCKRFEGSRIARWIRAGWEPPGTAEKDQSTVEMHN